MEFSFRFRLFVRALKIPCEDFFYPSENFVVVSHSIESHCNGSSDRLPSGLKSKGGKTTLERFCSVVWETVYISIVGKSPFHPTNNFLRRLN